MLFDYITINGDSSLEQSYVEFENLNKIIDLYHYFPSMKRNQGKNHSPDMYSIMSSNKSNNFGQVSFCENDRVIHLMNLLWERISSKYYKTAQAYKFFDINQNGKVSFNEFRVGSEQLGTKFTQSDLQLIFQYIDKNQDGFIDYNEFCYLTEEKRRNMEIYDKKNILNSETQSTINSSAINTQQDESSIFQQKKHLFDPQFYLGKNQNQIAEKNEEINQCISKKQADFKQRKLKQQFLNTSIQEQKQLIQNNLKHRSDSVQSFQNDKSSLQSTNSLNKNSKVVQNLAYGIKVKKDQEDIKNLVNFDYQQQYLEKAQAEDTQLQQYFQQQNQKQKKQRKDDLMNYVDRVNRKRSSFLNQSMDGNTMNSKGFKSNDRYLQTAIGFSRNDQQIEGSSNTMNLRNLKNSIQGNTQQSKNYLESFINQQRLVSKGGSNQIRSNSQFNTVQVKNESVPNNSLYNNKLRDQSFQLVQNLSKDQKRLSSAGSSNLTYFSSKNGDQSTKTQTLKDLNLSKVNNKQQSKFRQENSQSHLERDIDEIPFIVKQNNDKQKSMMRKTMFAQN